MKVVIIAFSAILLCSACSSTPPELEKTKTWGVSKSGEWEEQEGYKKTIISTGKPEHELPKNLGKN